MDELAQGRIDAAIVALPVGGRAFEEAPLFSEEFLLVRPAAQSAKPAPDLEASAPNACCCWKKGHCFRDQALAVCGLNPLRPRETLEASSLSTLVQMVGAGARRHADPGDGGGCRGAFRAGRRDALSPRRGLRAPSA